MGKTRAPASTAGVTLDTGALIALDRGDRRMIALLDRALVQRRKFRIPAGVVGQAWRDGAIQVALARFLRTVEVEIVPLDEHLSRSCGELCGATHTSDVIDTLGKKLSNRAATRCAHGIANSDLFPARRRRQEQKIRHVGAGNQ